MYICSGWNNQWFLHGCFWPSSAEWGQAPFRGDSGPILTTPFPSPDLTTSYLPTYLPTTYLSLSNMLSAWLFDYLNPDCAPLPRPDGRHSWCTPAPQSTTTSANKDGGTSKKLPTTFWIRLDPYRYSHPQMHTGATTAGVVGSKMPRLDVYCITLEFFAWFDQLCDWVLFSVNSEIVFHTKFSGTVSLGTP